MQPRATSSATKEAGLVPRTNLHRSRCFWAPSLGRPPAPHTSPCCPLHIKPSHTPCLPVGPPTGTPFAANRPMGKPLHRPPFTPSTRLRCAFRHRSLHCRPWSACTPSHHTTQQPNNPHTQPPVLPASTPLPMRSPSSVVPGLALAAALLLPALAAAVQLPLLRG